MLITPATLQGLQTNFSLVFQKAYESTDVWFDRIATTVPSTTRTNTYGWVERIPSMREWIGPRTLNNLKAQAYVLANKRFEGTIEVERDEIEDDDGSLAMYRTMIVPEFGRIVKKQPDILITQMLQANTALAWDGLPIFSNSHVIGSDTYDNLFSLTLNAANYETVRNAMVAYEGEDGQPLYIYPDTLFVAPQLYRTALEIVATPTLVQVVQNLAATENVAAAAKPNVMQGWSKVVEVREWANTPAMWVLADCSRPIKPVVYQLRRAAKFVPRERPDDPKVFDTNTFTFGTDGRWNVGVTLPFLMALGHA